MKQYKKMLFIVAHPDDAELSFGGTILKSIKNGCEVKVLVMTNGELAVENISSKRKNKKIRYTEQMNASKYGNFMVEFLGLKDGYVINSLKIRKKLIKRILKYRPDIIFTHAKNDYHPDHRYTGILVEDTLVLSSVSKYIKKLKPLNYNPIVLFAFNKFKKPNEFSNDVIVNISDEYEEKIKLAYFHKSQFKSFNDCKKMIDDLDELQLEILDKKQGTHYEIYDMSEYALDSEKEDFLSNSKL